MLQLKNDEERDIQSQKMYNDGLLVRNTSLASLQSHSPLYASNGSVYIQGTMCIELFKVMESRPSLVNFMVSPGAGLL